MYTLIIDNNINYTFGLKAKKTRVLNTNRDITLVKLN